MRTIRLLVGLGNPGPQYLATRHNAGFWWLDGAALRLGVSLQPNRDYFGLAARHGGGSNALWLLQPMTFMNLSGKAVAALARFYKIEPAEILIVHDELDLPPGQARLKFGGSASHNGLRDIHAQLGTADFWRLRLGIGHPGVKAEVVDYVLRRPTAEQREQIDQAIGRSLDALDPMLAGEMQRAMMSIHAKPPKAGATAPSDEEHKPT